MYLFPPAVHKRTRHFQHQTKGICLQVFKPFIKIGSTSTHRIGATIPVTRTRTIQLFCEHNCTAMQQYHTAASFRNCIQFRAGNRLLRKAVYMTSLMIPAVKPYFNSSATTENGGSCTCSVLPLRLAPLNTAGLIFSGAWNEL